MIFEGFFVPWGDDKVIDEDHLIEFDEFNPDSILRIHSIHC